MFDKYSKRNTKSMSNKRNCLKHLFLISLITMIFGVSCNMGSSAISERQDLTITPKINNLSTASIIPSTPTPVKLRFELLQEGEKEKEVVLDYAGSSASYTLEDVLVGSYDIYVYGLDSSDKEIMKGGPQQFTVKPNSSNNVSISLDYISEGTGSLKVTISWNPSELSDSPISDAIKSGRLGFLGFFGSGAHAGETLKGDKVDDGQVTNLIHRVENISTGKFEYIEETVPSTGAAGADIYFIVYTWDENGDVIALAKTFYTSVTVYDNLESVPDANETYNFRLDSSTIEGYISNVSSTTVKATPDTSSPIDTLIISWENPVFSADIYPITVNVWLTDESGNIKGTETFKYDNKAAAENEKSAKFSNLSSLSKYDVWFIFEGSIVYSVEEIKLEDVNPKIEVQSIAFPDGFSATYTAGQSVEITPIFTPDEATVKDFTIKEKTGKNGISVDGTKVSFDHAGSYTLTITSKDNPEATADFPVTIKLAKTASVSAKATDNAILVKWSAVADADGYKIIRTAGDGTTAEFNAKNVTEYEDSAVLGGETYTYTVQAIKNDDTEGNFTSEATASSSVSIPVFGIQVILPNVATAEFSTVLQPLADEYMDISDSEKDSITIGFSGEVEYSDGVKADTYTWKLNGTTLKSGSYSEAGTFTLDYTEHETAFHLGSDDSVNVLTVEISVDGKEPRTAPVSFHVLKGNPGTVVNITDANGDDKVIYNSSSDRTEKLTLNLLGNEIQPLISWNIDEDDKNIATIDEYGNLTVLKSGTVTVNAKVNALGNEGIATKEIACYVPIVDIKLSEPSNNRLIKNKTGVDVVNPSYLSTTFTITISGPDGVTPTKTVDDVAFEYNSSYISLDGTGTTRTIIAVGGGNTTVVAKADNAVSAGLEIMAHDFDLYFNNESEPATGSSRTVTGDGLIGNYRDYPLVIKNTNTVDSENLSAIFNADWCISNKRSNELVANKQDDGYFKINQNGNDIFSATLSRGLNAYWYKAGVILMNKSDNKPVVEIWFRANS